MGGGHMAWRKRVARGELAKGSGGAIMRHRPHLGRKGKDLIKNRKGHIGGGNPKKMKKRGLKDDSDADSELSEVEVVGETGWKWFDNWRPLEGW
eukprot:CAMPEP_0118687870 /NCGR_PEP_ID=MMETSP0800-20121206/8616_1 /TAXON_ID=210618 ORGANISM="Striatella unipunctata, Strain CCMP2910" /NCGR_SAMPLE_ID=MMETSP0800 /ASSEMBLY_ACC=CAM_ASM_000638 /LENGTH=93 /DNA_ID=CAMNT_0006585089 /DNA_START=62 /DNA_END=340 /DNA_ORIENTATION=+